jgi:hypothetical protein
LQQQNMSQMSLRALLTLALTVSAAHLPHPRQTNGGVHLAITPSCGKLGGTFANANAGIATSAIKTIVAFGVRLYFLALSY